MPTIEETIEFIKKAHEGQVTKAGEPYWTHPVAVMNLLPPESTDDEKHAALLHDVIEDTNTTVEDLLKKYTNRTVWLVIRLSRPTGEFRPTYMEWIKQIADTGDKGLINIKLADNTHNSLPERIAALPESDRDIVKRYERSAKILNKALQQISKVQSDD